MGESEKINLCCASCKWQLLSKDKYFCFEVFASIADLLELAFHLSFGFLLFFLVKIIVFRLG
jgi:hypothetical protein